MFKKLSYLITLLAPALCLMSSSAYAAEIVVVNEAHDYDNDGNQDDYQLVKWLEAEGHLVIVQHDNWTTLDPDKLAVLNAADLVIVSRTCNSTLYDKDDELTQWYKPRFIWNNNGCPYKPGESKNISSFSIGDPEKFL